MKLQDLEAFKEIKNHKATLETREGWTLTEHGGLCWWANHLSVSERLKHGLAANCYEGPDRFNAAAKDYLQAYPDSRLNKSTINS